MFSRLEGTSVVNTQQPPGIDYKRAVDRVIDIITALQSYNGLHTNNHFKITIDEVFAQRKLANVNHPLVTEIFSNLLPVIAKEYTGTIVAEITIKVAQELAYPSIQQGRKATRRHSISN